MLRRQSSSTVFAFSAFTQNHHLSPHLYHQHGLRAVGTTKTQEHRSSPKPSSTLESAGLVNWSGLGLRHRCCISSPGDSDMRPGWKLLGYRIGSVQLVSINTLLAFYGLILLGLEYTNKLATVFQYTNKVKILIKLTMNPNTTVEKKPPMNPSQVFFGDNYKRSNKI